MTAAAVASVVDRLSCQAVCQLYAPGVPVTSAKNYNITLSLPNYYPDNFLVII